MNISNYTFYVQPLNIISNWDSFKVFIAAVIMVSAVLVVCKHKKSILVINGITRREYQLFFNVILVCN